MKSKYFFIIATLFFLGAILRLAIAYVFFGSHEVVVWQNVLELLKTGKNIYTTHPGAYPYSPFFIYIFYFFEKALYFFSSYFVVKLPMILADMATGWILFLTVKRLDFSYKKQCLSLGLFLLNPVSILTSAFNASFGNISIMFVLWGIYIFSFGKKFQNIQNIFLFTLSLAVKHFTLIFAPLFIFLTKEKKLFLLFLFPAILLPIFFSGFYKDQSAATIAYTVLSYAGYTGLWGYTQAISNIKNFSFALAALESPVFFSSAKVFLVFILIAASVWAYRRYAKKIFSVYEAFFAVLLVFLVFTPGFGSDYYVWIIPFAAVVAPFFAIAYSVAVILVNLPAISWFYFDGGATYLQKEIIGLLNYFPYVVCVYFLLFMMYRKRIKAEKKFTLFFSASVIIIFLSGFFISLIFFQPQKKFSSDRISYMSAAEYMRRSASKEEKIFIWDASAELQERLEQRAIFSSASKYTYLFPSGNFEFPSKRVFINDINLARKNFLTDMQNDPPEFVVMKFGSNAQKEYENFSEFFDFVFSHYTLDVIFDDLWMYRYNNGSDARQNLSVRFQKDSGWDFVSEFSDRPSGESDNAILLKGASQPIITSSIETGGKIWKSPFVGKDRAIAVKIAAEETLLGFEGAILFQNYRIKIQFLDGSLFESDVYGE